VFKGTTKCGAIAGKGEVPVHTVGGARKRTRAIGLKRSRTFCHVTPGDGKELRQELSGVPEF